MTSPVKKYKVGRRDPKMMSTTNGRVGQGRQEDTEGGWERRPELAMILNKESEAADRSDGKAIVTVPTKKSRWVSH